MTELTTIQTEIIIKIIQLITIGLIGGGISWLYSSIQKRKETRMGILKEFSKIHGEFIALRYKFNILHLKKKDKLKPIANSLSEVSNEKWKFYKNACDLLGKFQSIKPLINEYFPNSKIEVNNIHNFYQDWRRKIRDNKTILQNENWESSDSYSKLISNYSLTIKKMRQKI